MWSFVKIGSLRNCEITFSCTFIHKSCISRESLTSQKCLLTLFAKIKFSQKVTNLQYTIWTSDFRSMQLCYCIYEMGSSCLVKKCGSWSAGFIRSQLIWIYTFFSKRQYETFRVSYVHSADIRTNTVYTVLYHWNWKTWGDNLYICK